MPKISPYSLIASLCLMLPPLLSANNVLPDIPKGALEIKLISVATGLDKTIDGVDQINPTNVVSDGSGRLFVTTLGGIIRLIDSTGTLLPTPYLNTTKDPVTGLADDRSFNVEFRHGFEALAFHPDFFKRGAPGFGKFYTFVDQVLNSGTPDFESPHADSSSPPTPFDQVLMEWTSTDPFANTFSGTQREVFRVLQPKDDHNADRLVFGPDGYLYFDFADGGNVRPNQLPPNPGEDGLSANSQSLNTIFGKISRIDPLAPGDTPASHDPVSKNGHYRTPLHNPFANDNTDSTLAEIYSYGHRNPYGLSFDPVTGFFYAAEVGQVTVEEVNKILPGNNYGWNRMEGSFLYDESDQSTVLVDTDKNSNGIGDYAESHGITPPIFEYDHADGQAIVGGAVYRGTQYPALYGYYVFGDLQGKRNGAQLTGARLFYGNLSTGKIEEFTLAAGSPAVPGLVYAIEEGPDRELYLVGGNDSFNQGVVYRLAPPTDPASYTDWAQALLPVDKRAIEERPFSDQLSNLVRYAFAIPPAELAIPASPPVKKAILANGDIRFSWIERTNTVAYTPRYSLDLGQTWQAANGAVINSRSITVDKAGVSASVIFPNLPSLLVKVDLSLIP